MARSRALAASRQRRRVLLALGWYAGKIHSGVARYAREAHWVLNLDMLRNGEVPRLWKGDGIITILGSNKRVDRRLLAKRVPIVNIGPGGPKHIPTVLPDNPAIGRLATEHFTARGFRHFAWLRRSGTPGEALRLQGFAQALARQDQRVHVIDWCDHSATVSSEQAQLRWLACSLKELPKPLAVFVEFDDLAILIMHACEWAGIRVPEQVAVLGVDNDELRCEFAPVPLSSIDDDQEGQGYAAAQLMTRILDGKKQSPRVPILVRPLGVITRQSTEILAVDHPMVALAIRAIWDRYTHPINASDIARLVPMSSRRLHDAFLKHLGRSIAQELARKRVEHAKDLLAHQSVKLAQVACESGFSCADQLTKVFHRNMGIAPSAFRRHARSQGS